MMAMRIRAGRRVATFLIFFLAAILSASALPAVAPVLDDSYLQAEFGEITSRPERFRDKRVCVKGGWIRRDILVHVDQINRPYKCTIEVEKFDPKVIEQGAYHCIKRYGEHVRPKIRLWWVVPDVKGVAPEACVIACGLFTVDQRAGLDPFQLENGTIEPCP